MSIERARSCFWFSAGLCFWPALVLILRWRTRTPVESRKRISVLGKPSAPSGSPSDASMRRAMSHVRRRLRRNDTARTRAGGYGWQAGLAGHGLLGDGYAPSCTASRGVPLRRSTPAAGRRDCSSSCLSGTEASGATAPSIRSTREPISRRDGGCTEERVRRRGRCDGSRS